MPPERGSDLFWHSTWSSANDTATIYDRGRKSRDSAHLFGTFSPRLPNALAKLGSARLPGPADSRSEAQFCAPPKPFIASVIPVGLSMIREKRTTVTTSSIETPRP